MYLTDTLKKLQIVLTAAKTTTDMPVVVSYIDTSDATFPFAGINHTTTNGTTPVDVVVAPPVLFQRKIRELTVTNKDTATKTVEVYLNDNATTRLIISCTLAVGDVLGFTDTEGWYTLDKFGCKKSATTKIPKKLGQGAIAVSPGTLMYTVPPLTTSTVKDMDIANTTAAALTCLVYFVPSGGSPAAANTVVPNVSIPANTMVKWSGGQILTAGDFIQSIGSAAGITITISGEEQT